MKTFENDLTMASDLPWQKIKPDSTTQESADILKDALETVRVNAAFNSVAMLDTKMLYVVASKAGLNELADEFRSVILDGLKFMQKPPIAQLKYEDIILNNPKDAMRTFTCSVSEASFYLGNQVLEGQLYGIIDALKLAYQTGDVDFIYTACAGVMEASNTMTKIQTEMDPSDYQSFRPYFDANPVTGERGPSGLFSAKIPHIEILLNGWANYLGRDYLVENVAYFPQRDMLNLRKSLNDGVNLRERFAGDASVQRQLKSVNDWLEKFQQKHRKSLRRQPS